MNRILLGIIILLFFSCNHLKKDLVVVEFKNSINCNKNGIPCDSLIKYYPIEVFQDTMLSDLRMYSYMYFKMNEPVLYNRYLKKEVYRLTSIRSHYSSPLVITIEKYKDSTVLITKELNRRIDYPFIKNPGPIVFVAPDNSIKSDKIKEEQRLSFQKMLEDSIAKVYRNYNYHLVLNNRIRISNAVWDSLEILIDSAKFWKSKPELDLSRTEDDDSRIILEGHSENGYQIKVMQSLHLYNGPNIQAHCDNFESKNDYTKILRFITRKTALKEKEIY